MSSIRHDWFQSNDSVFITFYVKNLKPEDVIVKFSPQTVHVLIDNEQVQFDKILNLSQEVNVDKCSYSIEKVKLEIQLSKVEPLTVWKQLEVNEESKDTTTIPKYPSSAKNPIDPHLFENEEKEDEPSGEAAINALFQKIYADASEDTRRAMMKSFIESKGTVLSTNWDEVGSKTLEPIPPKNN